MGQNPAALRVLRKQTKRFIDDDPFDIVLIPRAKTRVPGGGYEMTDQPPRPSQRVKLIYTGSARGIGGAEGVQVTGDGVERRYDYVIVGEWDMVIEAGDHWTDALGNRCEVGGLIPDNEYERRATASIYGRRAEGG
jgi:hypothetical protein